NRNIIEVPFWRSGRLYSHVSRVVSHCCTCEDRGRSTGFWPQDVAARAELGKRPSLDWTYSREKWFPRSSRREGTAISGPRIGYVLWLKAKPRITDLVWNGRKNKPEKRDLSLVVGT